MFDPQNMANNSNFVWFLGRPEEKEKVQIAATDKNSNVNTSMELS